MNIFSKQLIMAVLIFGLATNLNSMELRSVVPKSSCQRAFDWTNQKCEKLKQSIRNNPWKYALGTLACAAAVVGMVYWYKTQQAKRLELLRASLPPLPPAVRSDFKSGPGMPEAPATVSTTTPEPHYRSVSGSAVVLQRGSEDLRWNEPIRTAPIVHNNPLDLLQALKKAIAADLTVVDGSLECSDYNGHIDLQVFKQITNTTQVAALHDKLLTPIKDAFMPIAGFSSNPPTNESEMRMLQIALNALQQKIWDALSR